MKLTLFIFIYTIQIILASLQYLKTCKNKNLLSYLILVLHHILDVYVFFGIFISETYIENMINLIVIILIILHWLTNNYTCFLTVYLNRICKEDDNTWLYSLMYQLHKITDIYYLHSYWILGVIIYYLYNFIDT